MGELRINWAGHEALYIQLLRLRDTKLALGLVERQFMEWTLGELDIGAIDWWLEWLEEGRGNSGFWLASRMAHLFARGLDAESRHAFVAEFNTRGSRFRRLLANYVLPNFPDLTTDAFSEDAISYLLADLNRSEIVAGYPDLSSSQ